MQVYVWQDVDRVSESYHHEGGLVIVAFDLLHARQLAAATDGVELKDDEMPTRVIACADNEKPAVFVFPNAGCC